MPKSTKQQEHPFDKFFSSYEVDNDTDCWNWKGSRSSYQGYGVIYYEGKRIPAHRFAYILFVGFITSSSIIHHTCENKGCVNPAHLCAITHAQHKSLHAPSKRRPETCVNGHRWDEVEYYINSQGYKVCKICQRASVNKSKKRMYEKLVANK
jgi:hypothetical protein